MGHLREEMCMMEKRSAQAEVRLQASVSTLQQELERQQEEHRKEVHRKFNLRSGWSVLLGLTLSLSPSRSFQPSSRRVGSC